MKMKKTVYLILALVMAALLALPFARGTAAVSAQELQAALAPAAEEEGMEQKDEGQLCTLLQIRSDAYEEAVYFGAPSYMDVEEIIILYSPSHKGELLEKMQEHIKKAREKEKELRKSGAKLDTLALSKEEKEKARKMLKDADLE